MNQIEIYSNKKKAFLSFIASLIFVVLGFYFFINPENFTGFRARSLLFIRIIGIASILFFGIVVYVSVKQLITNKLLMIIDEKGISLNPGKKECIKWESIEGFSEIKISGNKIIVVQVNNPEEFINKETNKIRKSLMKFNLNNYGSPYTISIATMNLKYNELFQLLNENFIKYKRIT